MEMIKGYEDIRKDTVIGEWQMSIPERDLITSHDTNNYVMKKEKHDNLDSLDEGIDKYIIVSEILNTDYFSCLYRRWISEILHSPIFDINHAFNDYKLDSLHNLIYNPGSIYFQSLRTTNHEWACYEKEKHETVLKRLERLYEHMGGEKDNISSTFIMMETCLNIKEETSNHRDIDEMYEDEVDEETLVTPIDIYTKLCELRGYDK